MKRPTPEKMRPARGVLQRLQRFPAAESGVAAVEFAFVSLPFFALLLGIFELGLIFLLSTTLDNALATASRHIRTGEYQTGTAAVSASDFKTDICNNLGWLEATCSGNLSTDVETFTTFKAATNMVSPMNGTAYDPSRLTGYKNTAPCDIVVVRAYYRWPLIAPGMSKTSASLSDGSILLTSTVAFRNEPFTASVTSC
jgi:Flp pilus assembly protein TadG